MSVDTWDTLRNLAAAQSAQRWNVRKERLGVRKEYEVCSWSEDTISVSNLFAKHLPGAPKDSLCCVVGDTGQEPLPLNWCFV